MQDEDRLVRDRTAELKSIHGLSEEIARTVALSEVGYSFSGIANETDVIEQTAKRRIEWVEEQFGYACAAMKFPEEMNGPLEGEGNRIRCPRSECKADAMVSVKFAEKIMPNPTPAFRSALEAAKATGMTHICSTCNHAWHLDEAESEDHDGVLTDLKTERGWIARRRETKKPVAPWNGSAEKPVNAHTVFNQTSFSVAWDWFEKLQGTPDEIGLGFALSSSDPFVAIDLDDCRDAETGELTAFAQDLISAIDSYTEVSPSGEGIHILCRGDLPENLKEPGIEMYDDGQYVTVTFDHLDGTPEEPQWRGDVLQEVFLEHGGSIPDEPVDYGDHEGDFESPIYTTPIPNIVEEAMPGVNVPHPVHGSTTGENFEVNAEVPSQWWCFRHGVAGNVAQLIAMMYLEETTDQQPERMDCREVCSRWRNDDELVAAVWAWAVEQDLIPPSPLPPRLDPSDLSE